MAENFILLKKLETNQKQQHGDPFGVLETTSQAKQWEQIYAARKESFIHYLRSLPKQKNTQLQVAINRTKCKVIGTSCIGKDVPLGNSLLQNLINRHQKTLLNLSWWQVFDRIYGKTVSNAFLNARVESGKKYFQEYTDKISQSRNPANEAVQSVQYLILTSPNSKWTDYFRKQKDTRDIQFHNISHFSFILNQAQELRNVLLEKETKNVKVILISDGMGTNVVHTLLDQFPSYRNAKFISGWITIDSFVLGGAVSSRSPASGYIRKASIHGNQNNGIDNHVYYTQNFIHPIMNLGEGFPVYNIKVKQDNFSVIERRRTIMDAKNITLSNSSQLTEKVESILSQLH